MRRALASNEPSWPRWTEGRGMRSYCICVGEEERLRGQEGGGQRANSNDQGNATRRKKNENTTTNLLIQNGFVGEGINNMALPVNVIFFPHSPLNQT